MRVNGSKTDYEFGFTPIYSYIILCTSSNSLKIFGLGVKAKSGGNLEGIRVTEE